MNKINSTNRVFQKFILIIFAVSLLSVSIYAITKKEVYIGEVNRDICILCGSCWSIDPVDFVYNNGTLIVINPISYPNNFKSAQISCPVDAILSNF